VHFLSFPVDAPLLSSSLFLSSSKDSASFGGGGGRQQQTTSFFFIFIKTQKNGEREGVFFSFLYCVQTKILKERVPRFFLNRSHLFIRISSRLQKKKKGKLEALAFATKKRKKRRRNRRGKHCPSSNLYLFPISSLFLTPKLQRGLELLVGLVDAVAGVAIEEPARGDAEDYFCFLFFVFCREVLW